MNYLEFSATCGALINEVHSAKAKSISVKKKADLKKRLDAKISSILEFYDAHAGWSDQVHFLRKVVRLFRSEKTFAAHLARSLVLFGVYDDATVEQMLPVDKSRYDLFSFYSKATNPEELEKCAYMVERMSKVWQERVEGLDDVAKKHIQPAIPLNHIEFTKFVEFSMNYKAYLHAFAKTPRGTIEDTPLGALVKLGERAEKLASKILAACQDHYRTGDMAFLNSDRWEQLDVDLSRVTSSNIVLNSLIHAVLGPAGHPFLVDKSVGTFSVAEVDTERYSYRKISLYSVLLTDSFRVNFEKLLTPDGRRFIDTLLAHVQKLKGESLSRDVLMKKMEECFQAEVGKILHPDDMSLHIDRLYEEFFKDSDDVSMQPKLQSLWNSTLICCYAGLKAFFPYRFSKSPPKVVLQGGMICSEFAIKVTYQALKATEDYIKYYLRIWLRGLQIPDNTPETQIDGVRLFHSIIPDHIDMHRIIPANVLRYAKPYLEYIERPEILQRLITMPQQVLETRLA